MKYILLSIFIIFSSSVSAALSSATIKLSFSDRAKIAKDVEADESTQEYFKVQFYPYIGKELAGVLKKCTSVENASLEDLAIVADVSEVGNFINIVSLTDTNTSICFTKSLARLHAPLPPKLKAHENFPVIFEIKIKP